MNYFNPCERQIDAFPAIQPGTPMSFNTPTQSFQSGGTLAPMSGMMPGMMPGMQGMQPVSTTSGQTVIPVTGSTLAGSQIAPTTLTNPAFIPGFLRTQIGKKVRVEFLIGTGTTTDRIGTLTGVGASFILLLLEDSDDTLMADLYSIKFVTIYH